MEADFSTPMMQQYLRIKEQYKDCLLFFRLGDFYELFLEDAQIGAQVLNITLTSRSRGKDGRIPMAGVPYHAVDVYLAKLVQAGYKVAICEQMTAPGKVLVEREVIRVVTPGTMLDENALTKNQNNYIISIDKKDGKLGLAVADLSTGYFAADEFKIINLAQQLQDEISKISPIECIVPEALYNDPGFLPLLNPHKNLSVFFFLDWEKYAHKSEEFLQQHFGIKSLELFHIPDKGVAQTSAAALIRYLQQTQKSDISHIKKIHPITSTAHLILDRSTIINLELFTTIREHDTHGSLLSVIDQTATAMGGRLLKQWLLKPLAEIDSINQRLDAVQELGENSEMRDSLRVSLKEIYDVERLISRLSVGIGNARDLMNLNHSLQKMLDIKSELGKLNSSLGQQIKDNISSELEKIILLIDQSIVAEPPITLKDGGLIKNGQNTELDRLRQITGSSRDWILQMELQERKRTGISSLKVRFNKVFGFYIEISNANLTNVPDDYIRKQTLVNGERYITPELKKHEEVILRAEEKINELEYQIYIKVLHDILPAISIMQDSAQAIARLDCVANFSLIAQKNNYTRPEITESNQFEIIQGRHPVVEQLLQTGEFVPNDIAFFPDSHYLMLVTGPNMAGKSVLIRQVALISLMAQMGSFVPAKKAVLAVVDRIFVRSGASDVITSGLSTFMVEMVETAHILHFATDKSLVIMDEIGRGTSTYDGISIAWAVAEYLVSHFPTPPKVLFATHYHELQKLEEEFPNRIKNFHMSAENDHGEPIFLHTILPGGASHSFGVAVAKLAGVPTLVLNKANEMLSVLEARSSTQEVTEIKQLEYSDETVIEHLIAKELLTIDVSQMTPLEALNKLAELKNKVKVILMEDKKFLQD